jgi:hypothetical protein
MAKRSYADIGGHCRGHMRYNVADEANLVDATPRIEVGGRNRFRQKLTRPVTRVSSFL